MKVVGASLDNGLLYVDVVREVPEAAKPRTIKIGTTVEIDATAGNGAKGGLIGAPIRHRQKVRTPPNFGGVLFLVCKSAMHENVPVQVSDYTAWRLSVNRGETLGAMGAEPPVNEHRVADLQQSRPEVSSE